MEQYFEHNTRLGIKLPSLDQEWDEYDYTTRQNILFTWEKIRGNIPDLIKEIEGTINVKQAKLEIEENFELTCQLNSEIAEHASVINDLWIWYRTDQDISSRPHH